MAKELRKLSFLLIFMLISGCSQAPSDRAQGYIEGDYTYMSSSVSGVLKELLVARGSQVKKGQTLFVLEKQPESDAYTATAQNLEETIKARDAIAANLEYAKLTYDRYKILVPKKAIQQSQLDNAKAIYNATFAQLSQAEANIAQATAQLAESKWTLEQKVIAAPVDAIVFDTYFRLGENTPANQAILSLLAPSDIKAVFYVKEAQLGGIRLADKVSVHCDGCTQDYTGHVSFISPTAEYTPPIIYSTETSAKLVFRIEADFSANDAYQLHPGQPVTVTYYPHE